MEWGEWWKLLGWFFVALFVLFMYFLIVIRALTTKREIKEEYEFIGVMEIEQDTDDNDSDNDGGLRSKFNGESG